MAEPPTDADRINPSIALLFCLGRDNIIEALNTVFPAQLKSPAAKANMHIGKTACEKYAAIRHGMEITNPRLITKY